MGLASLLLPWLTAGVNFGLYFLLKAYHNSPEVARAALAYNLLGLAYPFIALLGIGLAIGGFFRKGSAKWATAFGLLSNLVLLGTFVLGLSTGLRQAPAVNKLSPAMQTGFKNLSSAANTYTKAPSETNRQILKQQIKNVVDLYSGRNFQESMAYAELPNVLKGTDEVLLQPIEERLLEVRAHPAEGPEAQCAAINAVTVFELLALGQEIIWMLNARISGDPDRMFEHLRHMIQRSDSGKVAYNDLLNCVDNFSSNPNISEEARREIGNFVDTARKKYTVVVSPMDATIQHLKLFFSQFDSNTNFREASLNLYHGRRAYDQKDFKTAERYYTEALKLLPTSGNIHTSLGDLYLDQGQNTKALESCQKAAELIQDHGSQDVNRDNSALSQAYTCIAKTLVVDSNNPSLNHNDRTAYRGMAADLISQAVKLDPNDKDAAEISQKLQKEQ